MSEKAEKKPDAEKPAGEKGHDDAHGKAKGGGIKALLTKLPVILGAAMLIEAVVLFAGFKFLGGGAPRSAAGAELASVEGDEEHGEAAADEHGAAKADEHGAEAKADDHGAAKADEHGEAKADAHGDKPTAAAKPMKAADKRKPFEIALFDIKAPNKQTGRTFLYDVSFFVATTGEHKDAVATALKSRDALIKDRVRTIIAQSDPDKLGGGSEPGLETLRRQVKYQLDQIIGPGMIDEVLVPRCIPYRADY